MGVNSMKVTTKMFNEDFIEVANNLPKMQNRTKTATDVMGSRARSEQKS